MTTMLCEIVKAYDDMGIHRTATTAELLASRSLYCPCSRGIDPGLEFDVRFTDEGY